MVITKRSINNFVLFLFLLICIFFPADPYNLKPVTLMFLFIINGLCIAKKIGVPNYKPVLLMGLVYPILIMMQSIALTGNIRSSISGAYSPVILILLIPIVEYNLDYKKQVLFLLKIMAISVLLIVIADAIGALNVNGSNIVRNSFYTFGMGIMGKSKAYSSYYKIFFKASPLLVLLLDDSISKQDYKWIIISFSALWLTGTRANVFSALIILFFRYGIWNDSKKLSRYLIGAAILAISLFNVRQIYDIIVNQMNTSGALASDLVRQGELMAYKEMLSHPIKLIFGSGFGSSFYNYGRNSSVYTSELSYLELIRCIGLIFAIPFFIFIFNPIFSRKVKMDYKLSFICYLLIAATNPLLFSSTAMIMYMFLYEDMIKVIDYDGNLGSIDGKPNPKIRFVVGKRSVFRY